MYKTKLFAVYEDGKQLYKGSAIECMNFLDLTSKDIVYSYARNKQTLYGKYIFKRAGERVSEGNQKVLKKQKQEKPKLTKHEEKLNYLVFHLNLYGNTIIKGDPKSYLHELKQQGINVSIRPNGRKDYILERV